MHRRLSVTEGLKSFEVEIVNDLAIKNVSAVIMYTFLRLSIRTKQCKVGFKRYI